MDTPQPPRTDTRAVAIPTANATLTGDLAIRPDARGLVVFAHGSGSSRHSPRNRFVAGALREGGLATLLMDLLTVAEETEDMRTGSLRFDIGLLARRLIDATDWLVRQPETQDLPIGYFGASTGAGAALVAAAEHSETIRAVVSRGGRPDLAGLMLAQVRAPTLLIVGGEDLPVIQMNRDAMRQMQKMQTQTQLEIVPGATHLFEEPGTLEQVAILARGWFTRHLAGAHPPTTDFRASDAQQQG